MPEVNLQVFGRFGREDSTAIITHKGGSLAIKVLRERAVFSRIVVRSREDEKRTVMTFFSQPDHVETIQFI
jgi:hypothetical protein